MACRDCHYGYHLLCEQPGCDCNCIYAESGRIVTDHERLLANDE